MAEIEKKEQASKAKGLPFNRAALLRRIAQSKGRFYDSAEYILKNGEGPAGQKTAYFNTEVGKHEEKPMATATNKGSRFAAQQADDDDDSEADEGK